MKIYKEFTSAHDWDFVDFLYDETWAGAQTRIKTMSDAEFNELLYYLESIIDDDEPWSMKKLNDFIWFDWDEIYDELRKDAQ